MRVWLVMEDTSLEVVESNIFYNEKKKIHELWITRDSGKTIKVKEGKKADMLIYKEVIDYARNQGIPTVELDMIDLDKFKVMETV